MFFDKDLPQRPSGNLNNQEVKEWKQMNQNWKMFCDFYMKRKFSEKTTFLLKKTHLPRVWIARFGNVVFVEFQKYWSYYCHFLSLRVVACGALPPRLRVSIVGHRGWFAFHYYLDRGDLSQTLQCWFWCLMLPSRVPRCQPCSPTTPSGTMPTSETVCRTWYLRWGWERVYHFNHEFVSSLTL